MTIEVTKEMMNDYYRAKYCDEDESYWIRLGQELFDAIEEQEKE